MKLLIEKGADIDAKDGNGDTALHWPAAGGLCGIIRLLMEKDANTKAKKFASPPLGKEVEEARFFSKPLANLKHQPSPSREPEIDRRSGTED